jgi:hypothetical protein
LATFAILATFTFFPVSQKKNLIWNLFKLSTYCQQKQLQQMRSKRRWPKISCLKFFAFNFLVILWMFT